MRNALDILGDLGRVTFSLALLLVTAVFVGVLPAGAALPTGTPTPEATPAALLDTAPDDAWAEGQDVLMLPADYAPADLVDALLAAGYRGTPIDACDCLYVPVGTVVDVPGGLYLATSDGWMICRDGWSEQECSATGRVWPIGIPMVPPAPAAPVLST